MQEELCGLPAVERMWPKEAWFYPSNTAEDPGVNEPLELLPQKMLLFLEAFAYERHLSNHAKMSISHFSKLLWENDAFVFFYLNQNLTVHPRLTLT